MSDGTPKFVRCCLFAGRAIGSSSSSESRVRSITSSIFLLEGGVGTGREKFGADRAGVLKTSSLASLVGTRSSMSSTSLAASTLWRATVTPWVSHVPSGSIVTWSIASGVCARMSFTYLSTVRPKKQKRGEGGASMALTRQQPSRRTLLACCILGKATVGLVLEVVGTMLHQNIERACRPSIGMADACEHTIVDTLRRVLVMS